MRGLVTVGIVLVVAWAVAFVVFKVAGFFIHVLLLVGAIVLIWGLIQRARGAVRER